MMMLITLIIASCMVLSLSARHDLCMHVYSGQHKNTSPGLMIGFHTMSPHFILSLDQLLFASLHNPPGTHYCKKKKNHLLDIFQKLCPCTAVTNVSLIVTLILALFWSQLRVKNIWLFSLNILLNLCLHQLVAD